MTQFFVGTRQELITELNNYENVWEKDVIKVECVWKIDKEIYIYKIYILNK